MSAAQELFLNTHNVAAGRCVTEHEHAVSQTSEEVVILGDWSVGLGLVHLGATQRKKPVKEFPSLLHETHTQPRDG